MSHYEERLERDLQTITARVKGVAARIEQANLRAADALLTDNHELAAQVIIGDLWINREIRAIDKLCHAFVARHLPGAGHLRFVSSVLRLNLALERIGDYAVTIAREAVQLSSSPPTTIARDIETMADQSVHLFRQAMKAFHEHNAEMARGTKAMASEVGDFDRVFTDLLAEADADTRPAKDLFALLVVLNRLDRVRDQAKNICEETIFVATGETKQPKVYRVLFLDERNDCLSQIAEAYAHKAFPESGIYSSAGWNPAGELDPAVVTFLDQGLQAKPAPPKPLRNTPHDLNDYHVIVGLDPNARKHLIELPFHTVLLQWDIPHPAGMDDVALQNAFRSIATKTTELMEALRGEDAA
jgi:phosphate transport system protein